MRIALDLNVLLDVAQNRPQFLIPTEIQLLFALFSVFSGQVPFSGSILRDQRDEFGGYVLNHFGGKLADQFGAA